MRIAFIAVGCAFFIAPQVGLVDILPDFIGIALLMFGISKIADLDVKISGAKRRLTVALYISAAKLVCFVGVITRFFDGTMNLTLSFVSGVLECIFLMPAVADIAQAISDISPRRSNMNTKTFTAAFFVLRGVGAFAPDMAGLITETSGGEVSAGGMTGEQVRGLLIAVFAAATLIVGAVWLIYTFVLDIRAIRKDEKIVPSLEARYREEILSDNEKMLSRRAARFADIGAAATIMLVSLRIDGFFITPEFLFGVIMIIAAVLAGEFGRIRGFRAVLVAFAAASAMQFAFSIIYSAYFSGVFMPYESEGFAGMFAPVAAFAAAAYVLLAVSFVMIGRVMKKFTVSSVGLRGTAVDERRRDIDAERRDSICRRISAFVLCGCVYSAAAFACVAALPFLEWIWIIKTMLGALMFVFYLIISRTVKAEAENSI